jgi:nicotinamide mononucleotide (NMN) deamidase PncC
MEGMYNPAPEIIEILCSRGLTLGTVESATGGLMAHLLTNRFVIPAPWRGTG